MEEGTDPAYAEKLIQFGWETITEALKQGGITLMMDRLSNPAKLRAFALSEQLKTIMAPLFQKHMDDIISGEFSSGMMADWANDDKKLLTGAKRPVKPRSKPHHSMTARSPSRSTSIKAS